MEAGLSPLFNKQIRLLPLEDLDTSEFNVRRREITADLDDLAKSMDSYGLYQPIVVTPKGDRFAVVVGQRRYLAAKQLGWDQMPALILTETPARVQATVLSLSENVQRRDLSRHATKRMRVCTCESSFGTNRAVAEAIGVTPQTVRNWLGYAAVPEPIKEMVHTGGLTVQQATNITKSIDDEGTAIEIARRVADVVVKDDRVRILESAKELPGRSVETILRRADQKKILKEITFVLPESSALAMERAEGDLETEASDIAMGATTEWLQDNGYLR